MQKNMLEYIKDLAPVFLQWIWDKPLLERLAVSVAIGAVLGALILVSVSESLRSISEKRTSISMENKNESRNREVGEINLVGKKDEPVNITAGHDGGGNANINTPNGESINLVGSANLSAGNGGPNGKGGDLNIGGDSRK